MYLNRMKSKLKRSARSLGRMNRRSCFTAFPARTPTKQALGKKSARVIIVSGVKKYGSRT